MSKCTKCEEQFPAASLVEIKKGMRFCQPCHALTYFKCQHCEATKLKDENNPKAVGDAVVCEYCFYMHYRQCKSCRVSKRLTDGITSGAGNFYCQGCAADRFFTCSWTCGQRRELDHLWERTPEGPVCQNCQSSYTQEKNPPPIQDYSFKPKPKMQGKSSNGLYFGVELEVDLKKVPSDSSAKHEASAKALRKAMPFVYCKRDGSIPCGFEIVTHPMAPAWIAANKAAFDPIWELVKKGYVSHDSTACGMHVHMSKAGFSPMHLYRFLQFFQKNKEFILVVSQRKRSDLDTWASVDYKPGGPSLTSMAMQKGGHHERRQAVNMKPHHTVEIRIFRGTLKKERFFKNLEFCQALYEFTKIVEGSNCTLQNFLGYLSLYKKEYRNLYDFLSEKYKWAIVKKKFRKGEAKYGVRYSGPIGTISAPSESGNTDVPDADWAAHIAKVKDKEAQDIQDRVSAARR